MDNNEEKEIKFTKEDIKESKRSPTPLEYINSFLYAKNYASSYGSIIMNSGTIIRARKYFDYFKDMWNEYRKIEAIGTKEELIKLFKEKTNGGIVTNGEIDIFLPDVSVMVTEYKYHETNNGPPLDDYPEFIDDDE
ncbi:MAG TPA: hypothetical protein VMZ91_00550 [Candidatus Paceibacterota bacterium]|nr:hypothetical protein [Candidatus Paceibacterota bacterium]